MTTEEPAWRAELHDRIAEAISVGMSGAGERVSVRTASVQGAAKVMFRLVILERLAAEQRGREAAVKGHVDGLKAEGARFRGRVLHEVWEAMRDAEGGPLIDAMHVVNALMDKR